MKSIRVIAIAFSLVAYANAQESEPSLPEGARLLSEGHSFPEGPLIDRKGRLYFSDPRGNEILQVNGDTVKVVAKDTQGANGIAIDKAGEIFVCQGPGAAVAKLEADGTLTPFITELKGKPLNSPNDLVFDKHGTLYFSNPGRGKGISNIVRVDSSGNASVACSGPQYPNGVGISPDEKWLYVCDTMGGSALWRYPLSPEGVTGEGEVLVKYGRGGPDGIAIAASGNIYVAMNLGSKLVVTSPKGDILKEYVFPRGSAISNVCFGGTDWKTLYVTFSGKGTVYSFPADEAGHVLYGNRN